MVLPMAYWGGVQRFGYAAWQHKTERESMFKTSLALSLTFVLCASAHAFSPSCFIGGKCVKSQGTSIPSGQVIEMMERCGEFTQGGIGRQVLRLSIQQINECSQGNITHPIFSAYYAFTELYDSPLKFDRKSNVQDTSYDQIVSACWQLTIDFEKWSR